MSAPVVDESDSEPADSERNSARLADVIGVVHAGGNVARVSGAAFGDLLADRQRPQPLPPASPKRDSYAA